MTVKGSCSCGKVSYKISGKLQNASSCHCSMCRKVSGSQSSAIAQFPGSTLTWLGGKGFLTHYKSSDDMGTYFCSICGSPLAATYQGETLLVTLGSIDGDPGIKVESHIFMGSKAAWETTPEEVKIFTEFPEQS